MGCVSQISQAPMKTARHMNRPAGKTASDIEDRLRSLMHVYPASWHKITTSMRLSLPSQSAENKEIHHLYCPSCDRLSPYLHPRGMLGNSYMDQG
jgi:hypothetical protein